MRECHGFLNHYVLAGVHAFDRIDSLISLTISFETDWHASCLIILTYMVLIGCKDENNIDLGSLRKHLRDVRVSGRDMKFSGTMLECLDTDVAQCNCTVHVGIEYEGRQVSGHSHFTASD